MNTPSLKTVLLEAMRVVLPLLILGAGVADFAALSSRKAPPSAAPSDERAPLVETAAVQPHVGGLDLSVDGLVVPFREVSLAAEVAGRVTYKAPEFRAGRYVTQGTLLVEIDPRMYELEAERLTKEVQQAEVNLAELDVEAASTKGLIAIAEEHLVLQQRHLKRIEEIVSRRAGNQADLDEARRQELTTRNNLVTLQNQLQLIDTRRARLERAQELAAARLEQAKLDLERTKVHSPVDGVVVSDSVEQDSYVQPGTALAVIEDTSAVEVRCSLRMDDLNWLWQQADPETLVSAPAQPQLDYQLPAAPVTVLFRSGGREYAWDGVLSRYDGIGLDERTRTVPVRVLVSEPRSVRVDGTTARPHAGGPRALVRGMYVSVVVHAQPHTSLLRLPEQAVQPGNRVWRVDDGRLHILPVTVARRLGNTVLVHDGSAGLRADDRVVVSPVTAPFDGMPVRQRE